MTQNKLGEARWVAYWRRLVSLYPQVPYYLPHASSKRNRNKRPAAVHTKCMLESRLSEHLKYLFRDPCWHPDSSHPSLYPKLLQLTGFPSPSFLYNPAISVMCSLHALPHLFWFPLPALSPLPLSLSLSFFSRPGEACWSCLVYYFVPLLWSPPGASGCALPYICNKHLPLNHTLKQSCPHFIHNIS